MKLSGATQQSLARLLEQYGSHSLIDGLYLRCDVPEMQEGTNKARKATNLVRVVNGRNVGGGINDLVAYIGSSGSGFPAAFRRGSAESLDFYAHFDKDSGATSGAQESTTSQRQFRRPGTSSPPDQRPVPSESGSKRYVFLVHGRDAEAKAATVEFLRSLDLRVVSWDEAAERAGGGAPHTLNVVRAGIEMSDAVVVLMTPDDEGRVKQELFDPVRDDHREAILSGQARQNVIFEAGWALALDQEKVVLVRVGDVRPLSDIAGLQYIWLNNEISARRQLMSRLRSIGLSVRDDDDAWRTAGRFPDHA